MTLKMSLAYFDGLIISLLCGPFTCHHDFQKFPKLFDNYGRANCSVKIKFWETLSLSNQKHVFLAYFYSLTENFSTHYTFQSVI